MDHLGCAGRVTQPQLLPGGVRYGAGALQRRSAAPAAVARPFGGPADQAGTAENGAVIRGGVAAVSVLSAAGELQPLVDPINHRLHACWGLNAGAGFLHNVNTWQHKCFIIKFIRLCAWISCILAFCVCEHLYIIICELKIYRLPSWMGLIQKQL